MTAMLIVHYLVDLFIMIALLKDLFYCVSVIIGITLVVTIIWTPISFLLAICFDNLIKFFEKKS